MNQPLAQPIALLAHGTRQGMELLRLLAPRAGLHTRVDTPVAEATNE